MGNVTILTEVEYFDFENLDITRPTLFIEEEYDLMRRITETLNFYLPENFSYRFRESYCDAERCILGAAEPERLKELVRGWNEKILERAKTAAKNWLNAPALDSHTSYLARNALREANDDFFVDCTCATYIERKSEALPNRYTGGWHTVMSAEDMLATTEHPERYLVISAYWS